MRDVWSKDEVDFIVKDYFDMLLFELQSKGYNKSEHRRNLVPLLKNRSDASIERKHQNISAVLIEMGIPFVLGYKPLKNYQRTLLPEVIESHLIKYPPVVELISADVDGYVSAPTVQDIINSLVEPPDRSILSAKKIKEPRQMYGIKKSTNYLAREASNQSLGKSGEQFVISYEKARLAHCGKENLAEQIEHVSVTLGDGAGFDIRSYETNGKDRFIEVKTTKYGKETPFFVTANELQFSDDYKKEYFLYRLFEFRQKPKLFTVQGFLQDQFNLSPTEYLAKT